MKSLMCCKNVVALLALLSFNCYTNLIYAATVNNWNCGPGLSNCKMCLVNGSRVDGNADPNCNYVSPPNGYSYPGGTPFFSPFSGVNYGYCSATDTNKVNNLKVTTVTNGVPTSISNLTNYNYAYFITSNSTAPADDTIASAWAGLSYQGAVCSYISSTDASFIAQLYFYPTNLQTCSIVAGVSGAISFVSCPATSTQGAITY